jgi:hypothetical protein
MPVRPTIRTAITTQSNRLRRRRRGSGVTTCSDRTTRGFSDDNCPVELNFHSIQVVPTGRVGLYGQDGSTPLHEVSRQTVQKNTLSFILNSLIRLAAGPSTSAAEPQASTRFPRRRTATRPEEIRKLTQARMPPRIRRSTTRRALPACSKLVA